MGKPTDKTPNLRKGSVFEGDFPYGGLPVEDGFRTEKLENPLTRQDLQWKINRAKQVCEDDKPGAWSINNTYKDFTSW